MEPLAIASLIMAVLSALPLVLFLVQRHRPRVFGQQAETTTATVLHSEQKKSLKGGHYYVFRCNTPPAMGSNYLGFMWVLQGTGKVRRYRFNTCPTSRKKLPCIMAGIRRLHYCLHFCFLS